MVTSPLRDGHLSAMSTTKYILGTTPPRAGYKRKKSILPLRIYKLMSRSIRKKRLITLITTNTIKVIIVN